eukprot:768490-Hanusia_phi.AAC.3
MANQIAWQGGSQTRRSESARNRSQPRAAASGSNLRKDGNYTSAGSRPHAGARWFRTPTDQQKHVER